MGQTNVGQSQGSLSSDGKRVNRYSLPTAATVNQLKIYLEPTSVSGEEAIEGVVYSDSGGSPDSLLGVSGPITYGSTQPEGWYTLVFPVPLKLAAGEYWIGVFTGGTSRAAGYRYDTVTGAKAINYNQFASGPSDPFGSYTTQNEQLSLYATGAVVPSNAAPPTISGTAQQEQTLIERPGTWTNEPTGFSYEWLRCDAMGSGCLPIAGAASTSYAPTAEDVGHTLRVEEVASNEAGASEPALSAQTAVVLAAPAPEPTPPPDGFVTACGTQLCLNGAVFRFDGGNVSPECSPPQNIEAVLGTVPGIEVIRSWQYQPFSTREGRRDWTEFDQTLAVAAAHHVRVIVTLEDQWTYCVSTGYKNRTWYETGYKEPQGGELVSYRQWVKEVAERYKGNTALLAYQLVNEAEDPSAGGVCEEAAAASALRSFTDDVGGMIHAIDPNHLVDLGTIGTGNCGTANGDYRYVHESPGTDLCEYHDYGEPAAPIPGDAWNGLQVRLLECSAGGLDKPLMVDETGIETSSTISSEQRAIDFDNKFLAQFSAGVVGELFWSLDADSPQFGGFDIGPSDPSAMLMSKY
jgi:mannan endo-1,4-beta-mannosidase